MKKVNCKRTVAGLNTFYLSKEGKIYDRLARKDRVIVDKNLFTPNEIRNFWSQYNSKPRKPGSGGARPNAGRSTSLNPGLEQRKVNLTDMEYEFLVGKHGTFTEAVRSLLYPGWEFDLIGTSLLS